MRSVHYLGFSVVRETIICISYSSFLRFLTANAIPASKALNPNDTLSEVFNPVFGKIPLAFSPKTTLSGVLAGSLIPAASFAFATVLSGVRVATDPSLNVTVAVPSGVTSTFATFPGLASSIAFLTASFSACVKFAGSATGVLAGSLIPAASSFATVLSGVSVATDPSLNVTVAVPSGVTSTFATFPGLAS